MFPENSNNMLVKVVSFYLKRFQKYRVLEKMYNFLGHPVFFWRSGSSNSVSRTSTFHVHST